MPDFDSLAPRLFALPPSVGGFGPAWAYVAGELDLPTPARSEDQLEIRDLDLRIADETLIP